MNTPPLTLLVALSNPKSHSQWSPLDSIYELSQLAKTAGLQVVQTLIQTREIPHIKYYVGEGKVEEIKALIEEFRITLMIVDDELSPSQNKALETTLNIKVIDRTGLILDIFARNAKTFEAQLQVELAQLEYLYPRLTKLWTHLSRLGGGGVGTRGPGEKQLEVDKRQIRHKITAIKKKLEKIKSHRQVLRQKRENIPAITGAIVGYTNAGKSTLLNTLTKANALAENKLFATLDPTTKPLVLPSKETLLLTDTVGFIQKLPHQLVSSFHATLEEIIEADFLLHVIDASHPKALVFIQTALATLKEIKADHIPQIFVFNKMDQQAQNIKELSKDFTPHVFVSALEKTGLNDLLKAISNLRESLQTIMEFTLNYSQMNIVNLLHQHGQILEERFEEDQIYIKAKLNEITAQKILYHFSEPHTPQK